MERVDETEGIRRAMIASQVPGSREFLEQSYGQVWDSTELSKDFEVMGFMAPLVAVRRKADNVKGSLQFQGSPRYYFDFRPE